MGRNFKETFEPWSVFDGCVGVIMGLKIWHGRLVILVETWTKHNILTLQLVSKLSILWFFHFSDHHYFFLGGGGGGEVPPKLNFLCPWIHWTNWELFLCVITPASFNKPCSLPKHEVKLTSWKTFVCNETVQTRNWGSNLPKLMVKLWSCSGQWNGPWAYSFKFHQVWIKDKWPWLSFVLFTHLGEFP